MSSTANPPKHGDLHAGPAVGLRRRHARVQDPVSFRSTSTKRSSRRFPSGCRTGSSATFRRGSNGWGSRSPSCGRRPGDARFTRRCSGAAREGVARETGARRLGSGLRRTGAALANGQTASRSITTRRASTCPGSSNGSTEGRARPTAPKCARRRPRGAPAGRGTSPAAPKGVTAARRGPGARRMLPGGDRRPSALAVAWEERPTA